MTKDKGGRPTVLTPNVLQKLEDGFRFAFNDEMSALYAGISARTLYNYQKENPRFVQWKQALKRHPDLLAQQELVRNIPGNLNQARWWAEHKMSEDFGVKTTVKHEGKIQTEDVTPPSHDAIQKAKKAFQKALYDAASEEFDSTISTEEKGV